MSTTREETSDGEGAAPLDLRVKKEVKAEPNITTHHSPLNLSKAPTPPRNTSPPPLNRESDDVIRILSEGHEPGSKEHSPRHPHTKHSPVVGQVGKASPVPMGASLRNSHAIGIRTVSGSSNNSRHVGPVMANNLKPRTSEPPEVYNGPQRQLVARGLKQEPIGNVQKATSASGAIHAPRVSPHVPVAPHIVVGPPASSLSPSKMSRHIVSSNPNHDHPHQGKIPSPRSSTKKPANVRRDYGPIQRISQGPEVTPPKVSPPSLGRHGKQEKELQTQHIISPHGSAEHQNASPLVAHGTAVRTSNATSHAAPTQKAYIPHTLQSVGVPHQDDTIHQHQLSHISAHPAVQHELVARGVMADRNLLTKSSRPPAQSNIPQQHSPQLRTSVPSHVSTPPVEALLRQRHPVTSTTQGEGVQHHSLKTPHLAGPLTGPRGPAPPQAPSLPTHPLTGSHPPQGTVRPRPAHPPFSSAPHQIPSHQMSKAAHEAHHERIRHPVAGQGYIPPGSEYYAMGAVPRGPLPSSAPQHTPPPGQPPINQPPGSTQAPQGYPSHTAPYPINPFVSLSIAIDCQRATDQDSDGDTALHISIVQDKADMGLIRRLIELVRLAGKTVDIFNYMQQTPLHLSCIMKNADIIRLLVEAGANPNEADRNGQTAAHHACKNDSPGCLGAILRYSQVDVNLNIRNYEGYTPLHLAAMIGNPTLVTMLLEKGADINSKDSKNGWTPLFHAVTNQDTKLVHKMLSSGGEVNVQSYSGNTVLHVATGRGYTDIVKILVHYGADMSLKNTQWDTPATITTDKNMSTLLRGLGAGSPQASETSSPSTPAPTLPMPLNDAYLIRPVPTGDSSSASTTPSGLSPSKTPTVTTMTTERLKGSANEVYTVTRSVTRPDSASPKSPDGQRAMHKTMQEKLRQSIQCRKFVNELRSESLQKKASSESGMPNNDKLLVIITAKKDKDGRYLTHEDAKQTVYLSDLEKRIHTSAPSALKIVEGGTLSPTYRVAKVESDKAVNSQVTSKSTPDVVPTTEAWSPQSISSKPSLSPNVMSPSSSPVDRMDTSGSPRKETSTGQDIPSSKAELRTLPQRIYSPDSNRNQMITEEAYSEDKDLNREPKREEEARDHPRIGEAMPRGNSLEAISRSSRPSSAPSSESASAVRARMLSLQYKNSKAIMGHHYERKLESVGSEQEHDAVTAMLAMGSGYREHTPLQKQQQLQQQHLQQQPPPPRPQQTCDADSTVKAEPASPAPVLSSTSEDVDPSPASIAAAAAAAAAATAAAKQWPQNPPVLEREGGQQAPPHSNDDDDGNEEPSLIIDESFKTNSRKRSRTPPRSVDRPSDMARGKPTVPPEGSNDDSRKGTGEAIGDSNIIWKKKAMMAMKRKRTEKSSS